MKHKKPQLIAIMGAGPVGLRTAELLAKKGHKVIVLERKSKIGLPIQCTGIVTKEICKVIRLPPKVIANTTQHAIISSPNNTVKIPLKDIILHRDKFDQHLAKLAKTAGADIRTGMTLNKIICSNDDEKILINILNNKTRKTSKLTADILIGADGPNSKVSEKLGNKKPRILTGIQATLRNSVENTPAADKDTYAVYLDNKKIPGLFGWSVPESSDVTRTGMATTKEPRQTFERFIDNMLKPAKGTKHKTSKKRISQMQIQAGSIPLYDPHIRLQNKRKNMFIVGDAATQVKATTGGGIIPGLKAADILADCITTGKDYQKTIKKNIGKDLRHHLFLRNTIDKLENKDLDILLDMLSGPKLKKELARISRDKNPILLVVKSCIKNPRILRFLKFVLKSPILPR